MPLAAATRRDLYADLEALPENLVGEIIGNNRLPPVNHGVGMQKSSIRQGLPVSPIYRHKRNFL